MSHNEIACIDDCLEFQNKILPGVSRTFALTIPQLPEKIQIAVANAYLLCRIADTIEDTTILNTSEKKQFHSNFTKAINNEYSPVDFAKELSSALSSYENKGELFLIENTEKVLKITHSLNNEQQKALSKCVAIMSDGMYEFEEKKNSIGLDNLEEMNRYCYFVAGVVGEMLTELFCDYSAQINQNRDKLLSLSVSFGQGLQMTNILKDIWDDSEREACWLPQDIFLKHGFDLQNLFDKDVSRKGFSEAVDELVAIANRHLKNALEYTLLIPKQEKGIRRFCLWAIGMALLTLRKIKTHKDYTSGEQVKISRKSVKTTIIVSNIFTTNNFMLRRLLNSLSKNLSLSN